MPKAILVNGISAACYNGVLEVVIPKAKQQRAEKVKINIM